MDVGSAVNLVGAVLKYLGAAFLFPALIALGSNEQAWPFVVSAAITGGDGVPRRAGNPREGADRPP